MITLVLLVLLATPRVVEAGSDALSWELKKQTFLENEGDQPAEARKALIEIIEIGDTRAAPFLRELFDRDPGPQAPFAWLGPEFTASFTYRGIAHSGLAALGDEEAWNQLRIESFHPNPHVRLSASWKIQRVPGERAVEALSNFLGDSEGTGYEATPVEYAALFELSKRLNPPPFLIERFSDLHGYYESDGREQWLRWRYENYGPIPGREELFAQFIAESTANSSDTDSGKDSVISTDGDEPQNTLTETGTAAKWWLWSVGGIVALFAIVFAALKKSA